MNIQEEVRINMCQPCIMADTETGELLKAITADLTKDGHIGSGNMYFFDVSGLQCRFYAWQEGRARQKKEGVTA